MGTVKALFGPRTGKVVAAPGPHPRRLIRRPMIFRALTLLAIILALTLSLSGPRQAVGSGRYGSKLPATVQGHRSQPAKKARKTVIVLDPGHGGWDSGGVHVMPNGRIDNKEKWVTLKVALLAARKLRHAGYTVFLTRTRDQAVNRGRNSYKPTDDMSVNELEARVLFSNKHHARIFVSIHINGDGSPSVHGLTVYYNPAHKFSRSNLKLARSLDTSIESSLSKAHYRPYNWGVHTDVSDLVPQHFADYPYFLQIGPADKKDHLIENKAVSALGETLFITNYHEDQLLKRKVILEAIASGYTDGIERYLKPHSH